MNITQDLKDALDYIERIAYLHRLIADADKIDSEAKAWLLAKLAELRAKL